MGTASTAFVENKLSRSLISLSLLFTTLPRSLQRTLVRPSVNCYIHFSLVMNSSLRFVSLRWESSDLSSGFAFTSSSRFRFNSSPSTKLVDPLYHKYSVICVPDSQWISVVQFLGSSLTVLFTINHVNFPSSSVGGSTFFHPHLMYGFTQTFERVSFGTGLLSPSLLADLRTPPFLSSFRLAVTRLVPIPSLRSRSLPISLATTLGISVDFFSWY